MKKGLAILKLSLGLFLMPTSIIGFLYYGSRWSDAAGSSFVVLIVGGLAISISFGLIVTGAATSSHRLIGLSMFAAGAGLSLVIIWGPPAFVQLEFIRFAKPLFGFVSAVLAIGGVIHFLFNVRFGPTLWDELASLAPTRSTDDTPVSPLWLRQHSFTILSLGAIVEISAGYGFIYLCDLWRNTWLFWPTLIIGMLILLVGLGLVVAGSSAEVENIRYRKS